MPVAGAVGRASDPPPPAAAAPPVSVALISSSPSAASPTLSELFPALESAGDAADEAAAVVLVLDIVEPLAVAGPAVVAPPIEVAPPALVLDALLELLESMLTRFGSVVSAAAVGAPGETCSAVATWSGSKTPLPGRSSPDA